MIKKIFCILFFICILCGCTSVKDHDDFKTIKNRGRIIVGVRSDTRPFGYRDSRGNIQGFDVDLAREIARHIFSDPSAVELVPVTAANRIAMLTSGRVDMLIATMSITDQRRMIVDFSRPYYLAGQAILVKNRKNITTIKQINGKKIIIVYGSTGEESIRLNAPQAIIRGFKDYNLAYNALKRGVADAMIADDTVLYNLALDDPSVKILKKRFTKEPYAIAFRKGENSIHLQDTVEYILNQLEHCGELKNMQRKWGIYK